MDINESAWKITCSLAYAVFSFSFYLLIKKKITFSFLLSNLNQFHRGSIFGHYKFLLALGLSELSPSSSFSRSQTSTQAGDDDARGRLARRRNRGRECSEEAAVNYYGGLRRECVLNSKDFFFLWLGTNFLVCLI